MKTLRIITCLFAVVCGMVTVSAEARFYKANSIHMKYVYYEDYAAPTDDPEWDLPPIEYHYAEMWTGNDTIVDGYECVTLWDKDEGESPVCIGCLREDDNGWVWRYEMATRFISDDGKIERETLEKWGIADKWVFLYDFSRSDWAVGMYIEKWWPTSSREHFKGTINGVVKMTLKNGEEVPVADGVIYGIGYPYCPFEGNYVNSNKLFRADILEYWREGVLLIKNDDPTSLESPIQESSSVAYDLTGRPVDGAKKGIYIRNGKKILVK